jgi:hypothetical protein
MFRRLRTGRARWVVAAASALALLGGGLFVALPAQADTTITDSFESEPYYRWTVDETRGRSLVELTNHQHARSGSNVAWLEAYPASIFSARIYRTVTLDDPGGCCGSRCYASAYLKRPYIGYIGGEARPGTPRVTLQVRAGGPSGARLSGASFDLPAQGRDDHTWGRADFGSFAYRPGSLTIDISVQSGTAYVDDVTVACQREIR